MYCGSRNLKLFQVRILPFKNEAFQIDNFNRGIRIQVFQQVLNENVIIIFSNTLSRKIMSSDVKIWLKNKFIKLFFITEIFFN